MSDGLTVFWDDGRRPHFEHGKTDAAAKARVVELFTTGRFSIAYDGEGTTVYSSNPVGVFNAAGEKVEVPGV